MEERKSKVMFNHSGKGKSENSYTTRISLPITWLREMDITIDDRNVDLYFDGSQITIKKSIENK